MSDSRKKICLAVLFAALVILIMAGSLMPVAEMPGRYGGVFDIGLNAVGMAGGMGVFFKIFRKSGG